MDKKTLHNEWENYKLTAFNYAYFRFENEILPWLTKKGYTFVAGMGTWVVLNNGRQILRPLLPKYIRSVLEMDVPGFNQDLGSLMPDLREEEDAPKS